MAMNILGDFKEKKKKTFFKSVLVLVDALTFFFSDIYKHTKEILLPHMANLNLVGA